MSPERKPLGDMTPAELREAAWLEYRAVYGRAPRWKTQQERRAA